MPLKPQDLIAAYGAMVHGRLTAGDDAFLLTFMFNPLPGNDRNKLKLMHEEVTATYYKLLTRAFRHPNKVPTHAKPMWIALPDLPVFKHDKDNYRDVAVNSGLHYHAIALMPGETRLKQRLDHWFREQQRLYTGRNRYLFRVHGHLIESEPGYVVGYGLKTLKNGAAAHDDLLVLPHATSELPSRTRSERREAKQDGRARRRQAPTREHRLSNEAANVISRVGLE